MALGDLKEYTQSVVIPDETRLRELYYAVDTRSLSLLQTRAEIVKNLDLNERNKQSRDFEKIMKMKKLHDITSDIGSVLADLMVLLNNWNSLLKSIGGFQYVKDLAGILYLSLVVFKYLYRLVEVEGTNKLYSFIPPHSNYLL